MPHSRCQVELSEDQKGSGGEYPITVYRKGQEMMRITLNPGESTRVAAEIPKIVCLCGSTKFKEQFEAANRKLTLEGCIVLSVGGYLHQSQSLASLIELEESKKALDELHMRKIDLADEIFVINVEDYVGDSTWNEIQYAHKTGKPIQWLVETRHVPGVGRNGA